MPCSLPVVVADLGAVLVSIMPGLLTLLLLATTEVPQNLLLLVQETKLTSLLMHVEVQVRLKAGYDDKGMYSYCHIPGHCMRVCRKLYLKFDAEGNSR